MHYHLSGEFGMNSSSRRVPLELIPRDVGAPGKWIFTFLGNLEFPRVQLELTRVDSERNGLAKVPSCLGLKLAT